MVFSTIPGGFGLVSFGMVWFGWVWYGVVWYGMVWFGIMFWYGLVMFSNLFRYYSGWVGGWLYNLKLRPTKFQTKFSLAIGTEFGKIKNYSTYLS